MKIKPIISIILNLALIIALAVKIKTWFVMRMWINPDATCMVCNQCHSRGNDGEKLQSFPTADEIINASVPYWRNGDVCGFQSYIASLYRDEGTNYLPIIALSAWNDRALLLDLESASDKFSLLQNFSTTSSIPKSNDAFYNVVDGLHYQIWLLNRDIYKDDKMFLRLIYNGGYRTMIKSKSHRFRQHNFDELHKFMGNAPSVFITNAIFPAGSVQNANPISRIKRKENLDAVIKSNANMNVLLCALFAMTFGWKISKKLMARKRADRKFKQNATITK